MDDKKTFNICNDLNNCGLINSHFLSKRSRFLKLWKYLKA